MEIREDRPPFVKFEVRSIEDRTKSIEEGSYHSKDVIYAVITPMGSKDKIERVAEEWLESLKTQVDEGRFDPRWLDGYKIAFKDFKEGRETPPNGTPVLGCSMFSRAQAEIIVDAGLRTLEDLAVANEGAISLMGIGGRMFKQKAEAYLRSAKDVGKTALEMESLKTRMQEMEERLKVVTDERDALAKEQKKEKA
jgi:hypothetical protein